MIKNSGKKSLFLKIVKQKKKITKDGKLQREEEQGRTQSQRKTITSNKKWTAGFEIV